MAVRRKARWWVGLALALVLLAGALAWVVALSFKGAPRRTVAFPDGSRLTVLGASLYYKPFTTDKPWQATLRRWLPAGLQGWLPVPVTAPATSVSASTSASLSNSIWVWFSYVDARGSSSLLSVTPWPWGWNVPVSESGSRYGAVRTSMSTPMPGNGVIWTSMSPLTPRGPRVYGLRLTGFPRRQREFELQFLDTNMTLIGSASVPNPVKGPFPEWKPVRLPVTVTNGPLVVTLEGLEKWGTSAPYAPQITPSYRVESQNARWWLATPASTASQWSDATGNLGMPLDYGEKVWKLSLQFLRVHPTNYSEAERFVLPGLTTPEPGTLQVMTNEFERLGMKFRLRCLAGAGRLAITNNGGLGMVAPNSIVPGSSIDQVSAAIGIVVPAPRTAISGRGGEVVSTVTASDPFFLLEATQPESLDQVVFRVLNSEGQELTLLRPISSTSSSSAALRALNRLYVVQFDATGATGDVAFEVTINRPRTVEFLVDPREVRRR